MGSFVVFLPHVLALVFLFFLPCLPELRCPPSSLWLEDTSPWLLNRVGTWCSLVNGMFMCRCAWLGSVCKKEGRMDSGALYRLFHFQDRLYCHIRYLNIYLLIEYIYMIGKYYERIFINLISSHQLPYPYTPIYTLPTEK